MKRNEQLAGSNFQNAISLAKTVLQMHQNENAPLQMHQVFNKQFDDVEFICDREPSHEIQLGAPEERPMEKIIFKKLLAKNFQPIKLG